MKTKQNKPRRRQSLAAARRPRFLVRSSSGPLGLRMVIKDEEIIACNLSKPGIR